MFEKSSDRFVAYSLVGLRHSTHVHPLCGTSRVLFEELINNEASRIIISDKPAIVNRATDEELL